MIKEGNYYRCCDSQPVQSDSYVENGSGRGRDLILTDLDEMQVKIKIDIWWVGPLSMQGLAQRVEGG